ncbi:alpha/beta hydrolase [Bradyrhizobium sp. cf659]|uniref:alpha/beta hydrolase n=1 Tax=Bradyrhizobium sp. cf659 TaxID=1761771 RepID=UPI0008E8057F|nr:alpha/beta fold hydrolase [Bradyrhizobium sp. cf659]SFI00238.1 Lysophospholipase, alpha-beta hydrolase superfamily [Bradyrhizobium sp. cf659]
MRWLMGLAVLLALARPACATEQELELLVGGRATLATLRTPASMGPDTPLIVMTHGTLAHKDMEVIQGVAKALEQRGIASLAHTLSLGLDRRKGMYDCATRHDYVVDDAVAEIGAWVTKAKSMSRFVFTFGHSRGGNQVARYLAAGETPPVAGAVLLAPVTAKAETDLRASYAQTYGKPLEPLLDKASKAVAAGRGGEWMDAPGFIYCRNAVVTARAIKSFYAADAGQDTAALVAHLKLPVLALAATKDTVVPDVAASFASLAASSGGGVQLDKIEDADHFFRDLFAEDVADRIVEFIKQTR